MSQGQLHQGGSEGLSEESVRDWERQRGDQRKSKETCAKRLCSSEEERIETGGTVGTALKIRRIGRKAQSF